MFFSKKNNGIIEKLERTTQQLQSKESLISSFSKSMAIIEFTSKGDILTANDNFLKTMEYTESEIIGKHHRIFCQEKLIRSNEYRDFWQRLASGEAFSGEFVRITHSGKKIWLSASYCPVFNANNQIEKIVKIAANVTPTVTKMQELQNQSDAVSKSMAVIEFDLNGFILSSNENFQKTMGYSSDELIGKHHRTFCTDELANSAEYANMWKRLNKGEFISGKFMRVDKQGNSIWLEATYNPIFNDENELYKVVKFATNITSTIENAKQASQLAYDSLTHTDTISQKGLGVVNQAISSMLDISKGLEKSTSSINSLNNQSDQISKIVDTITSIADQTNLLALNAALEAARAGEQGRGFAVVADEVRQLAARTSKSTSEIEDMVKENHLLANQAVNSMQAIVKSSDEGMGLVEKTGEVIKEISVSTKEIITNVKNSMTD